MPRERAACVTMPVIARLATEPEAAAGLPALQVGRDRIAPRRGMEIGGEGEQRIVVLQRVSDMGDGGSGLASNLAGGLGHGRAQGAGFCGVGKL